MPIKIFRYKSKTEIHIDEKIKKSNFNIKNWSLSVEKMINKIFWFILILFLKKDKIFLI